MTRPRGFTIIELMIVVSIVMILSGIALQNYQEASIRTRIAVNHSDFRTLAAGIELYRVDHNDYPRMAHWGFFEDPAFDEIEGQRVRGVMSKALSTPVAYVLNAHMVDPFMSRAERAPADERLYTYQNLETYRSELPASSFWPLAVRYYGAWRLGGVGPDQRFDHGFVNSAQLPYDPTNGLISLGNIWYSPTGFRESLPPIPQMLGAH